MSVTDKFDLIEEATILKNRLSNTIDVISAYNSLDASNITSLSIYVNEETTDEERLFCLAVNSNDPIYMGQEIKDAIISKLKDEFLPELQTALETSLEEKINELNA